MLTRFIRYLKTEPVTLVLLALATGLLTIGLFMGLAYAAATFAISKVSGG